MGYGSNVLPAVPPLLPSGPVARVKKILPGEWNHAKVIDVGVVGVDHR
jgi:hypothetical protein